MPAFVVIGGADAGAFYVRQLLRAIAAGRLVSQRIHVIDRDPGCVVSAERDPRVRLEVADWASWLDLHLERMASTDHLVPYHWAPHLLVAWLERQAMRAGASVDRGAPPANVGVPIERATADGDRALSYATWLCPPTCIEPALCPHTRGPKDWSLCGDLAQPSGSTIPVVFRCLHLVYGVGTIAIGDVLAARERLLAGLAQGPASYRVATSSHCHALATAITVSPCAARVPPAPA